MASSLILESAITCPHCGFVAIEVMPTDACLYFYACTACQATLRPMAGDCCVFCSFGSIKCPPVQEARGCCASPAGKGLSVPAAPDSALNPDVSNRASGR